MRTKAASLPEHLRDLLTRAGMHSLVDLALAAGVSVATLYAVRAHTRVLSPRIAVQLGRALGQSPAVVMRAFGGAR